MRMSKLRVTGGLEGAYIPSYTSSLCDSREEAKEVLRDKLREEKELCSQIENREILEEAIEEKGIIRIDRGGMRINHHYKIRKVDAGIVADHQANRMY